MTDIYLSDMSVCVPRTVLSDKPKKGAWRLIDYETEDMTGRMIWANSRTAAPDCEYPLSVSGWHAIYVGIWDWAWSKVPVMVTESQIEGGNMVRLRLKSDDCFTAVSKEYSDFQIEEVLWKKADLTGESLVVGQQSKGFSRRACLAYLRLVPLTESEVEGLERERKERSPNRRLTGMNDGWSWIYESHPTTREEIHSQLEKYRDTDFGMVCYESSFASSDPLRVYDVDDFPRVGEAYANDSIRTFRDAGIDPFREVVEYGHAIGLRIFGSVRLGMPKMPPPFDIGNQDAGDFFYAHEGLRCVDRDGSKAPCLSYAFPEVRGIAVKALQRPVKLGADGVTALFHRGPPFLLYEAPVVQGFVDEFGEDPLSLPADDERWLLFRAGYLTKFMRELRSGVRDVARATGRTQPKVSCVVFPTRNENLRYGIDLESWVKENLVDYILARDTLYATWESTPVDVPFFLGLTGGTSCEFRVMMGSSAAVYRSLGSTGSITDAYYRRAAGLYRSGVQGLAFWDTNLQDRFAVTWSAVRRLGHVDEVMDEAKRPVLVRSTPLKKLGGIDVSFRYDAWYYV